MDILKNSRRNLLLTSKYIKIVDEVDVGVMSPRRKLRHILLGCLSP